MAHYAFPATKNDWIVKKINGSDLPTPTQLKDLSQYDDLIDVDNHSCKGYTGENSVELTFNDDSTTSGESYAGAHPPHR